MGKPRIVYRPRGDATPEAELDVLASVYGYLLKSRDSKEGGPPTAPDDRKGSKRDPARTIIPEHP